MITDITTYNLKQTNFNRMTYNYKRKKYIETTRHFGSLL